MLRLNKTALAVSAVLLTCAFSAAAEPVLTVDTIVISGSRTAEDLLDVPSSITVVKPDNIIRQDNVADMLRDLGSVNLVSDGTPGVKHVSIRGENASRTLVMVDGQRIDDAKTKSGTPLLINPFFIDRIEVLKGPSSVLYGSDAMGGIVNVITKQASEEPFSAETGVSYIGSGNGFSEYLNLSGTVGKFSYLLGGFNTDMGDMYLSDRERLDNTSYYSKGGNAQLSYAFTDESILTFKSEYFDLNARTSTTDDGAYSQFRGHIPKWERIKHTLGWELNDINEYFAKLSVSAYYQENNKDFSSQVTSRGPFISVENEQDSFGGNLQLEFSLSEMFYLTTGYDGRVDELDAISSADISGRGGPVLSYTDNDYQQTSHALYALLETYLTERLTLSTGVRWNYVKTDPGESSMDYVRADGSFSNTHFVGSAGLVYRAFDNGAFRFNWSQGFRVPNIQELYLTTMTGELQLGNPNLEPETSDNFELGFRYEGNLLTTDFALFYTKADDYIDTQLSSFGGQGMPFVVYQYQNISEAESYGAEFSISYAFDYLTPYFDITLMEREYDTGSRSSKNTGTPKVKGRAGLKLQTSYLGVPYYVDGFVRFATASKNDNLDGTSYFDNTRYGGYAVFNLQAGCSFGEDEQYQLYVGVDNVFDKDYQTTELIKEPGRFFSAGFSARF